MNKIKITFYIKLILLAYALVGSVLFILQDHLLFHPKAFDQDSSYQFNQPYQESVIPLDAVTKFHVVHFTVPDSIRKGVVLYFHGNRKNIGHYAEFAKNFTLNNYEVWMIDYPKFGKSIGELTEANLYEGALQLYMLAKLRYNPSQIIIYGKSIGTGIATQLASVRDCKHLILETPYYSMETLLGQYLFMYPLKKLLHFKFPSNEYIQKVTAPVTIFHGTEDGVISYSNAQRFTAHLKKSDEFITIKDGTHLNLNSFKLMQDKLDEILR
ncbi:alpha/beta hydrolase [Sediminibacterium sp.]|uniref:alpha/beta hydrolase n=1 Tax=Sediminibacterium sp. TaxID=1917865 RepID=UPI003F6E70E6